MQNPPRLYLLLDLRGDFSSGEDGEVYLVHARHQVLKKQIRAGTQLREIGATDAGSVKAWSLAGGGRRGVRSNKGVAAQR